MYGMVLITSWSNFLKFFLVLLVEIFKNLNIAVNCLPWIC